MLGFLAKNRPQKAAEGLAVAYSSDSDDDDPSKFRYPGMPREPRPIKLPDPYPGGKMAGSRAVLEEEVEPLVHDGATTILYVKAGSEHRALMYLMQKVNRLFALDDILPEVPPEIAAYRYMVLAAPKDAPLDGDAATSFRSSTLFMLSGLVVRRVKVMARDPMAAGLLDSTVLQRRLPMRRLASKLAGPGPGPGPEAASPARGAGHGAERPGGGNGRGAGGAASPGGRPRLGGPSGMRLAAEVSESSEHELGRSFKRRLQSSRRGRRGGPPELVPVALFHHPRYLDTAAAIVRDFNRTGLVVTPYLYSTIVAAGAVCTIQGWWRSHRIRGLSNFWELLRMSRAARRIQRAWRGFILRTRLEMLAAVRRLVVNVGGLLLGANLALTAFHCTLLRERAARPHNAPLFPEQRLRYGFDRAGSLMLVEPERMMPRPIRDGNWSPGLPPPPVPRSLPEWSGLQLPLSGERAAVAVHGCREVYGLTSLLPLLTRDTVWRDNAGQELSKATLPDVNPPDPGAMAATLAGGGDAGDVVIAVVTFPTVHEAAVRAAMLASYTWDPRFRTGAMLIPLHQSAAARGVQTQAAVVEALSSVAATTGHMVSVVPPPGTAPTAASPPPPSTSALTWRHAPPGSKERVRVSTPQSGPPPPPLIPLHLHQQYQQQLQQQQQQPHPDHPSPVTHRDGSAGSPHRTHTSSRGTGHGYDGGPGSGSRSSSFNVTSARDGTPPAGRPISTGRGAVGGLSSPLSRLPPPSSPGSRGDAASPLRRTAGLPSSPQRSSLRQTRSPGMLGAGVRPMRRGSPGGSAGGAGTGPGEAGSRMSPSPSRPRTSQQLPSMRSRPGTVPTPSAAKFMDLDLATTRPRGTKPGGGGSGGGPGTSGTSSGSREGRTAPGSSGRAREPMRPRTTPSRLEGSVGGGSRGELGSQEPSLMSLGALGSPSRSAGGLYDTQPGTPPPLDHVPLSSLARALSPPPGSHRASPHAGASPATPTPGQIPSGDPYGDLLPVREASGLALQVRIQSPAKTMASTPSSPGKSPYRAYDMQRQRQGLPELGSGSLAGIVEDLYSVGGGGSSSHFDDEAEPGRATPETPVTSTEAGDEREVGSTEPSPSSRSAEVMADESKATGMEAGDSEAPATLPGEGEPKEEREGGTEADGELRPPAAEAELSLSLGPGLGRPGAETPSRLTAFPPRPMGPYDDPQLLLLPAQDPDQGGDPGYGPLLPALEPSPDPYEGMTVLERHQARGLYSAMVLLPVPRGPYGGSRWLPEGGQQQLEGGGAEQSYPSEDAVPAASSADGPSGEGDNPELVVGPLAVELVHPPSLVADVVESLGQQGRYDRNYADNAARIGKLVTAEGRFARHRELMSTLMLTQVIGRQTAVGHVYAPNYRPLSTRAMSAIVAEMRRVYAGEAAELVAAMREQRREAMAAIREELAATSRLVASTACMQAAIVDSALARTDEARSKAVRARATRASMRALRRERAAQDRAFAAAFGRQVAGAGKAVMRAELRARGAVEAASASSHVTLRRQLDQITREHIAQAGVDIAEENRLKASTVRSEGWTAEVAAHYRGLHQWQADTVALRRDENYARMRRVGPAGGVWGAGRPRELLREQLPITNVVSAAAAGGGGAAAAAAAAAARAAADPLELPLDPSYAAALVGSSWRSISAGEPRRPAKEEPYGLSMSSSVAVRTTADTHYGGGSAGDDRVFAGGGGPLFSGGGSGGANGVSLGSPWWPPFEGDNGSMAASTPGTGSALPSRQTPTRRPLPHPLPDGYVPGGLPPPPPLLEGSSEAGGASLEDGESEAPSVDGPGGFGQSHGRGAGKWVAKTGLTPRGSPPRHLVEGPDGRLIDFLPEAYPVKPYGSRGTGPLRPVGIVVSRF